MKPSMRYTFLAGVMLIGLLSGTPVAAHGPSGLGADANRGTLNVQTMPQGGMGPGMMGQQVPPQGGTMPPAMPNQGGPGMPQGGMGPGSMDQQMPPQGGTTPPAVPNQGGMGPGRKGPK